jgi:hypothetical protein
MGEIRTGGGDFISACDGGIENFKNEQHESKMMTAKR